MFPNYQQSGTTPAQPDTVNALSQQRPGQPHQAAQQTSGQPQLTPGSSPSHHQMLQQALQQNPHLAAQIQQRLQPPNVQVPGLGQPASALPSLQQQQQMMLQRQQAASSGAAAPGSLLHQRPPAKQAVAMARPAAGFSAGVVRPPSPAGQPAVKASVSAADMIPAAKRKKRKLMDNRLPEKAMACVPESALYSQLQEYERQLDSCILQKQAEVQDSMRRPNHLAKKLRLYVYNTHANQEASATSSEPPSWTLIIQGKLMEPQAASVAGQLSAPPVYQPPPHPFTHYIRRLTAKLDPEQYGDGEDQALWQKDQHTRNHRDSFEIRRRGSQAVEVSLEVEVDNQPERYTLSASLSAVLGLKQATRAGVLHALWAYIKANRLQSAQQASQVECNAQLGAVFQAKQVKLSSLSHRINPHLRPIEPLSLRYTVRVSGDNPTHPDSYDIDMEVPATTADQATASLLQNLNTSREVEQLDQRIMNAVHRVHEHKRRRAFFLGFSQSPVDFINALVASQARDLRFMKGENGVEYEAMRRTDLFKGKWVEDAVLRHLHKRLAAG
ncbi:hypothetical protein ABBQ32_000419 [Trebouxia sp. C0010 RCD-2024]